MRRGVQIAPAVAILAIALAALTRIGGSLRYVDFYGDEARDAFRVLAMHGGLWPTLGPETQAGIWQLPPLYYYLIFPTSLLGLHPVLQVLPNAVFSVASVPLLMFLIYRLLVGIDEHRRRLIAAAGGLWWSVLFADLFLNNREWNPSSIPFFELCLVLLLAEHHRVARLPMRVGIWIAIGVCLAVLTSLHGSTLFVMPVVFLAVTAFDVIRRVGDPRRWIAPIVSILTMIICLTPYWAGESARGWSNSRALVASIFAHGAAAPSVLARLNTARGAYTSLSGQIFFVDSGRWFTLVGVAFLTALVIVAAAIHLRGDRRLLSIFVLVWIVYLYAASNYYPNPNFVHYKLPLLFAPIILTALVTASLGNNWKGRAGGLLLIVLVAASIFLNARLDVDYLCAKAGEQRPMTVDDMIAALRSLPPGALVFQKADKYNDELSLEYLDQAVTHRQLRFVGVPRSGSLMIVPRFEYKHSSREYYETSDFHIQPADPTASGESKLAMDVVAEAPTYRIYALK